MLTHTMAIPAIELPLWFRIAISWGMIRFVYPQYFATLVFLTMGSWMARKEVAKAHGLNKVVALGPVLYAAPIAAFGASHLGFGSVIANMVPSFIPAHVFWIYFVGLCLIAAALSIVVQRQVPLAGTLLGILFLGFELTMHVPNVIVHARDRIICAIAFRDFSFGAAAWALAGAYTAEGRTRGTHNLITVGRVIIAVAAVFFGVEHFLHPEFAPGVPLSKVMPTWIPGRLFLSYITGAFLLIGGTSLLLRKKMRLAATSMGTMVLLGVLFVYLPIMVTIPRDIVNGFNYFADTLLYSGALLALAYALPKNVTPTLPDKEASWPVMPDVESEFTSDRYIEGASVLQWRLRNLASLHHDLTGHLWMDRAEVGICSGLGKCVREFFVRIPRLGLENGVRAHHGVGNIIAVYPGNGSADGHRDGLRCKAEIIDFHLCICHRRLVVRRHPM